MNPRTIGSMSGFRRVIGAAAVILGAKMVHDGIHAIVGGAVDPTSLLPPPLGSTSSDDAGPYGYNPPGTIPGGVKSLTFHKTEDINERARFIIDEIRKGSLHPDVVTMVRQLVSEKCGPAGDKRWCIDPEDFMGMLERLHWSVQNPNSPWAVRYTHDHTKVDFFAGAALTLRVPAEDCFVHGTRVLRDDYRLVPVETLKAGDKIWGKDRWSTVLAAADKGFRPTYRIALNNGGSMRLTPGHKVWIRDAEGERRIEVRELEVGMEVVRPARIAFGSGTMDPDRAWTEGVYLADGWVNPPNRPGLAPTRFSISGQDGKPKEAQKRRVKAIAERFGFKTYWNRKYLNIYDREWATRLASMGSHAPEKRVLDLNLDEGAALPLLEGIMADASVPRRGGVSRTLTTTSYELFLQARVLLKMAGVSASSTHVVDHGGLGENPIWRLSTYARKEELDPKWAKRGAKTLQIKSIERDNLSVPCFDIETDDHYVWLPEADWSTSQCDGMVVAFGARARVVGFPLWIVLVETTSSPGGFDHICLKAGIPPLDPTEYVTVDLGLAKMMPFGWGLPGLDEALWTGQPSGMVRRAEAIPV